MQAFWIYLKEHVGGVPGQKDVWRGATQWTAPVDSSGDRIGIYAGTDWLWLYIRAGETQGTEQRAARMRQYSWMIGEQMGDQHLEANVDKNSADGRTISVQRRWTRDDRGEWPEAARWIKEHHDRLQAILIYGPEPQ